MPTSSAAINQWLMLLVTCSRCGSASVLCSTKFNNITLDQNIIQDEETWTQGQYQQLSQVSRHAYDTQKNTEEQFQSIYQTQNQDEVHNLDQAHDLYQTQNRVQAQNLDQTQNRVQAQNLDQDQNQAQIQNLDQAQNQVQAQNLDQVQNLYQAQSPNLVEELDRILDEPCNQNQAQNQNQVQNQHQPCPQIPTQCTQIQWGKEDEDILDKEIVEKYMQNDDDSVK